MHPFRSATRGVAATLIAVSSILAIATGVLALDYGPTRILRTAPDDVYLRMDDIAAHDSTVAVVWDELASTDHAFLRVSHDGGGTFAPRLALHHGGEAMEPKVAACDAGVFAVSMWQTASGGPRVELDYPGNPEGLDGSGHTYARGTGADVACDGDWLGVAYFDTSSDPAHVLVSFRYLTDVCPGDCTMSAGFDLGPGRVRRHLAITIDGDRAYVAWTRGASMHLKRFHLDHGDAAVTVTPRPTQTIVHGVDAMRPLLAAEGPSVALAYQYQGDTRIRTSADRGRTFSGATVVYEAPCVACEAGSVPLSIDMLGGYTLLEVVAGPPGGAIGYLSDDGFDTWSETSTPAGARQVGAILYDASDDLTIAEARDNTVLGFPGEPGPEHQRIRFRTAVIP